MEKAAKLNCYYFGLGTVGRDMLYIMVSMYLMVYLTEILNLPDSVMWYMTGAHTVLRIFDAVNDPFMGVLVDNAQTRFGKFKPWIVAGSIIGGILTILLFTDFGFTGTEYVIYFIIIYLAWDLAYGINDIAYWSMLPSLAID
ncbi:MAG: MFS transporter [Firmicutes bacterium]|nr:MFS transporter [Bacillota bacterium]